MYFGDTLQIELEFGNVGLVISFTYGTLEFLLQRKENPFSLDPELFIAYITFLTFVSGVRS